MEKLIVKNFGPIKEADIDLTKYVVFIGDTSTGKSVLAKLISIFRDVNFSLKPNPTIDFKRLLIFYNIDFHYDESTIEYTFKDIYIKLENGLIKSYEKKKLIDRSGFEERVDVLELVNKYDSFVNNSETNEDKKEEAHILMNNLLGIFKKTSFSEIVYFPAERILNSIIGNSISGLWANNVALPDYFKNFAAKFEVARMNLKYFNYSIFGFEYKFENGEDKIMIDNKSILLSQSSSGIQSMIPLLTVFDYSIQLSNEMRFIKSILIEEPELNLFPSKQKKIIDYIVFKLNSTSDKILITTHSPYILSALDTLILAKNTFDEHPDLKENISNIVSEDKWIDYNDISVYEVRNDGKVYSIKNDEFKSIDANAIDSVSDIISDEFDKLTELRYAH